MKLKMFLLCAICSFGVILPTFAAQFIFSGAAVYGGAVFPENWDTGFNVGAGAYFGPLSEGIYLVPSLTYWESSAVQEDDAEVGISDFSIAVDVHYFFMKQQQGAYIGGGLSYNMLSWEYTYIAYPYGSRYWVDNSESKIGFAPLGGYLFNLGKLTALIEAKYNLISDFNTFQISLGLIFGRK
ncbi:MAG: hypothetical protein HXY24_14550 [Rubrivivax sp.]|nr:hypothetical protein [Rubrivivax sp.]